MATLSRQVSFPFPVAVIGGVVITFADLTGAKTLEMELREEMRGSKDCLSLEGSHGHRQGEEPVERSH